MNIATTFISNIREIIMGLGDFFVLKMLSSWVLVVAIFMVGQQHIPLLGTLTALVAIDLATGVYSAYKTKEPIESKKLVKTAIKWTLYILMISAGHLTEELIPGDWFVAEVTIAFLGATELISILENIGKTGVAIPLMLLNKLEEFSKKQ